jgi:hypothetical protein
LERIFRGQTKTDYGMKINILLIFLVIVKFGFTQNYIDSQQERIDALDGKIDKFLSLIDLNQRNSATYTYLTLVDELQEAILENDNIINDYKVVMFKELNKELFKIDANRLTKATRDEDRYSFLLKWIEAFKENKVEKLMLSDRTRTFSIINYIYPLQVTESFLNDLPPNYIDQILYKFTYIGKSFYGQGLIERKIAAAPLTAKKYFVRNQPVYDAMFMSLDEKINTIYSINEKYRRNTKAFVLLDKIMDGKLTLEQADEIGKDKERYFNNLLEIRAKENPLAEVSLDRELNYEALEYVREVNHLHESTNPAVRFAITKDLNAAELYTLLVYSEDEIFTSSFNGIYERLVNKMNDENITGYQLLDKTGFNRFRTFIKMISYYGKLSGFLKTMDPAEKDFVLRKFVGGIKKSKNRIEDGVSIANAISAIGDNEILRIFEEEIYSINQLKDLDIDTKLIYGLLIKLFNPKVQTHYSFFDSISRLYYTPPIDKIERSALLGIDGVNVQKHFFYDDDDGVASYNSFKASFNTPNWKIVDEKEYIKIVSSNHRVKIYANKPEFDETAWYYADEEIKKQDYDVEIIIHRGHSYYVDETIEKIPKTSKLILLGSCGGYNRLSQLLDKSDNAQIISTKQIGSMGVNNPLIFQMAEKIRKGEDLVWAEYWADLKVYFKGKGKSEARFNDYVPPHQNLGAKFIAAYNLYNWVK